MQTVKTTKDNPLREARDAVHAGRTIPATTQAELEARGIDVGAFEQRLIETAQFKH